MFTPAPWRAVARFLALLALLSGMLAPVAAQAAQTADPERATMIALFGADVLCLPTGDAGDEHPGLAAHDCQLCCTARLTGAPVPTGVPQRLSLPVATRLPVILAPAVPTPTDPHPPYRPRDPPNPVLSPFFN